MFSRAPWRSIAPQLAVLTLAALFTPANRASAQDVDANGIRHNHIVHEVDSPSQRLEMIVNSSRILRLQLKIPQAQVNNPEILEVTPLSASQIQIFAKKPGVTQVNLWDEDENVHTIDVIVYGDSRELQMLLDNHFPNASLKVVPLSNSVVISGYVENPSEVRRIIQIAEDYHPKVIDNIRVGNVQQVLLRVKVMEVSRTKLRNLGVDWARFSNGTTNGVQNIAGLLGVVTPAAQVFDINRTTFRFAVTDGGDAFLGFLEALRQNDMLKVLSEPTLMTVSGRPAFFNVGGEFPIPVPQSLGTISIEFKKFGTQVDFVPIVLGNGNIRLEVRPRVSEIDNTRNLTIGGTTVPGLRVREIDTGAELRAGQTLALAGLVQTRIEAQSRAIPLLGELPYIGTAFRRVSENYNEIELLILVTPELVDPMEPHEVPPGGPGTSTCSPTDGQLYFRGHIEVPCDCGKCNECYRRLGGDLGSPNGGFSGGQMWTGEESIDPGMPLPSEMPSDGPVEVPGDGPIVAPMTDAAGMPMAPLPPTASIGPQRISGPAYGDAEGARSNVLRLPPTMDAQADDGGAPRSPAQPIVVPTAAQVYRYKPFNANNSGVRTTSRTAAQKPGMIGPMGYDARQ